jgi:hypothetical protein
MPLQQSPPLHVCVLSGAQVLLLVQVWQVGQEPQSSVPPHPSGIDPHCPRWQAAGVQQVPVDVQTWPVGQQVVDA